MQIFNLITQTIEFKSVIQIFTGNLQRKDAIQISYGSHIGISYENRYSGDRQSGRVCDFARHLPRFRSGFRRDDDVGLAYCPRHSSSCNNLVKGRIERSILDID